MTRTNNSGRSPDCAECVEAPLETVQSRRIPPRTALPEIRSWQMCLLTGRMATLFVIFADDFLIGTTSLHHGFALFDTLLRLIGSAVANCSRTPIVAYSVLGHWECSGVFPAGSIRDLD